MKVIFLFLVILLAGCGSAPDNSDKIDRKEVVSRHNIVSHEFSKRSPAQVGNGEIAFGLDLTGLQTFIPFNTLSQWGWHSDPVPEGVDIADFKGRQVLHNGRMVTYPLMNDETEEQKLISEWLTGNPHRINLARIGFVLLDEKGEEVTMTDLRHCQQEVNLWTGIVSSYFELDSIPVQVYTACHPDRDLLAVTVESPLIDLDRLAVKIAFPGASRKNSRKGHYIGIWDEPDKHTTTFEENGQQVMFTRALDQDKYHAALSWDTPCTFSAAEDNPHTFILTPEGKKMAFTCEFSPEPIQEKPITAKEGLAASREGWKQFWESGAAIDLSESEDKRWFELERRIVLSRYLMKVNESGSLPPQESGLVNNNGWFGRFHFEMIWWHMAHWGLWGNLELADQSLSIYQNFLETARLRAESEGFEGAKWPKCTAYNNVEWPCEAHAFLIWQQPHPIYFAEMEYRQKPTRETLEKWQEVVFATAELLASLAYYHPGKDEYVLGPPIVPVSENTPYSETFNPTFELAYWRYGLRVAQKWYNRLSIDVPGNIDTVYQKLSPYPVEDSLYILYEGIPDMWTQYTFEHPAIIGIYGMLPGDDVDKVILERTFDKILETWNFKRIWGWDFPMLAMTAARLGRPQLAVDLLLHNNYIFDEHGLAYGEGSPYPYFPSNGGLLTAIAMMAVGWDGSGNVTAPGFPKDGSWKIKYENFHKYQ